MRLDPDPCGAGIEIMSGLGQVVSLSIYNQAASQPIFSIIRDDAFREGEASEYVGAEDPATGEETGCFVFLTFDDLLLRR